MNCLRCAGACCESLHLPTPPGDRREWLLAFGAGRELAGGEVELEVRCAQLTRGGSCAIYATRPAVCRNYQPGSEACYDVVRRRRTSAQYKRIRDAADPASL